jgi:hypothetical protein
VSRGRSWLGGKLADHMIVRVGHQGVLRETIWRDAHAIRMAEERGANVHILRLINLASRAAHRGCREDDVANQMVVSIGHQRHQAIWRDTHTGWMVEESIGSHSISQTLHTSNTGKGGNRGARKINATNKIVVIFDHQSVVAKRRDLHTIRKQK